MRIVEYGHIKPKEVKCYTCGSILEYVPNDLCNYQDLYFLMCPVCKHAIVKDNDDKKFVKENM